MLTVGHVGTNINSFLGQNLMVRSTLAREEPQQDRDVHARTSSRVIMPSGITAGSKFWGNRRSTKVNKVGPQETGQ